MDREQLRHNRAAWERIAESFDRTRRTPWSAAAEFAAQLAEDALVLDAGCGNGRHARVVLGGKRRVVGLDLSRSLLLRARDNVGRRRTGWVEGAVEHLPLRDARFDAVLALAVVHHVRGRRNRVMALAELQRVLRPGGRLLLSVWSRDQPLFGPGKEPRPPTDGRPVEAGDAYLRWTQHGLNVERFIHLYTWPEWNRDLDDAHVAIERVWPEAIMTQDEPDNFFAIVRRRSARAADANVKARGEPR